MAEAFVSKAARVGSGLVVGLVLTAATAAMFLWMVENEPDRPGVIALQFAGSAERALVLLDVAGREAVIEALRSTTLRDCFFVPVYVSALAWWCLYGSWHFRMTYSRRLARILAWSTVIAGLADLVENFWLLKLLESGGKRDGAARWVTAAAIPKWLLVICALPVGFAALITGLGRVSRRFRDRPAFPPDPPELPPEDPRVRWERPRDRRGVATMGRCEWSRTPPPGLKKRREPRLGVCFSGGGIRSATFNMGALQTFSTTEVPERFRDDPGEPMNVLERTDYLSCVSGGAYIAGSLQILAHQSLADDRQSADLPTFKPCSPEEHHVRLHGRYIADNLREWIGAAARVLAGTVMNLLVFALVLFVLARPLGWVQHAHLFPALRDCSRPPATPDCLEGALRASDAMWFAVGWPAAVGLLVLLGGTVWGAVEEGTRDKVQTMAFGFLALAAGVLLVVWLLPTLGGLVPEWVQQLGRLLPWDNDDKEAGATVILATAGGTLTASALAIINRPTPPPETAKTPKWLTFKAVKKWVGLSLPYLAGLLLALVALVVFAIFTSQAARAGVDGPDSFFGISSKLEVRVWAGAAGLLALLYLFADQTRWSLGPFYRRRLSSAFAIERVGPHDVEELPWNLPTTLSEFAVPHPRLPEVLVCAAANLSEQKAAPPGRRAVSFVFGAQVVGGPEVGWARTKDFEAVCAGPTGSDATFLSAIAISGAAFASAMGRHSKGAINSLLAASNARLGVWLPSPRYVAELRGQVPEPQYDKPPAKPKAGEAVSERDPPQVPGRDPAPGTYGGPWVRRRRFSYLFKELFGTYSLEDRFLYLTDGGHYENLGLVELLRRKCQVIVCLDASGDDLITCGTFVEALSLAEEELGVDVSIDLSPLAPRKAASPRYGVLGALDGRLSQRSVVRGRITYWDGTVGHIVLAKASLTEATPGVVLAHAARQKRPTFPNDSTGDQFFDQSQFNAYSELGRHVSAEVVRELMEIALVLPPRPPAAAPAPCPPCPHSPPCRPPTSSPCPPCPPCGHCGPCPPCPPCPPALPVPEQASKPGCLRRLCRLVTRPFR